MNSLKYNQHMYYISHTINLNFTINSNSTEAWTLRFWWFLLFICCASPCGDHPWPWSKGRHQALKELGSILTTNTPSRMQTWHLGVAYFIRWSICVWCWLRSTTAVTVKEEFAVFLTCFEAAWGRRFLSSFHLGGFHNKTYKCPKFGEQNALNSLQRCVWIRNAKGVQLSKQWQQMAAAEEWWLPQSVDSERSKFQAVLWNKSLPPFPWS